MRNIIILLTVIPLFLLSFAGGFCPVYLFAENGVSDNPSDLPVLPDEILKKKKRGWYPGILPIYNYTSENGHGVGVRAALFQNGDENDMYFKNTPYLYRIVTQIYSTTLGWQYHFVDVDIPYFLGSRFRVKTSAYYDKTTNANFFGIGQKETDRLTDNSKKTYSTYEDYYRNFIAYPGSYPENYKYDKYTIMRPRFNLNCYTNINKKIKILAGLEILNTEITPWGGREFDIEDENFNIKANNVKSKPTRIEEQRLGNQDGWINSVLIGAGYDTRDYEPDPKSGLFADCTLKASLKKFYSDYNYARTTLAARYYWTPRIFRGERSSGSIFKFIPTLAARAAYTTTAGDVPFHALGSFVYMYDKQTGLGGNRSLRGYKAGRFIGDTMTNGNIELRIEFLEFKTFDTLFSLKALCFADTGSVFDTSAAPLKEFNYYHNAFGGGLALGWNQSLIIHFYYGFSAEDKSISFDIGHAI